MHGQSVSDHPSPTNTDASTYVRHDLNLQWHMVPLQATSYMVPEPSLSYGSNDHPPERATNHADQSVVGSAPLRGSAGEQKARFRR